MGNQHIPWCLYFEKQRGTSEEQIIYLSSLKLEKGIVTDPVWTPNPRDVIVREGLDDLLGHFKYCGKFNSTYMSNDISPIDLTDGTYLLICTQGAGLDMLGLYLIGKTSYPGGCAIHEIFASERLKQDGVINFTDDYKLAVTSKLAGYSVYIYIRLQICKTT